MQIRVYGIDGSLETFDLEDRELTRQTLAELYPSRLFSQDEITISDDCLRKSFAPSRITRVDLITDNLSVWDFPFLLGALEELTDLEYAHEIETARGTQISLANDAALYLDLYMLDGRHSFLGMHIIAGLPSVRLNRIYSLPKERRLIFGLRNSGVGILNLANMVRFSVCPEPLEGVPIDFVPQDTHAASIQIKKL